MVLGRADMAMQLSKARRAPGDPSQSGARKLELQTVAGCAADRLAEDARASGGLQLGKLAGESWASVETRA